MQRRRRSIRNEIVLLLLIIIMAAPVVFIHWVAGLPAGRELEICLVLATPVAVVAYTAWSGWKRRWRQRRQYRQTLLDFRWHENISPHDFERCCADYLRLKGWRSFTTKGSGDQGIDVLAEKNGIRLVLQCKKYGKPVGNRAVQEAYAARAHARATAAAVVSNQSFTRSAHELAATTGVLLLHFTELRNIEARLGLSAPNRPLVRRPVYASNLAK